MCLSVNNLPVNVMVIGETVCSDDYYVCRNQSRIMAIEYIVSGSGTLNINSKSGFNRITEWFMNSKMKQNSGLNRAGDYTQGNFFLSIEYQSPTAFW